MSIKKWILPQLDKEKAASLADAYGFPPFLSLLMVTRGLDHAQAMQDFLEGGTPADPFCLPDMDRAVERVSRAIDSFEKIAIYGDYDADGVTATTILYAYLQARGADVMFSIPLREAEGYGLSKNAVDNLAAQGVRLIVTVDNGISSYEEIQYAKTLGIDTVVTDHHEPPERLPQAEAVVDPHRRDGNGMCRELCGAGVALMLIRALEGPDADDGALMEDFGDMAAIGTIADIVPLCGENRRLVQRCLPLLTDPNRLGLRALERGAGLEGRTFSAVDVAFKIAPRINAMGRMGAADRAVKLFLTDYEEEANALAGEMEQENQQRQQAEQDILHKAVSWLEEHPRRLLDRVLVVAGEDWHPGVLGIVSSKITERYGKPSFILSVSRGEAKGSGRSVAGFSLHEALSHCAGRLTRYGGHAMAAGLTMDAESVDAFREEINAFAAAQGEMPQPSLSIDCKLNPARITPALVQEIERLAPFGTGNPVPVFGLFRMRLDRIDPVGGGKHLRLTLSRDGISIQAMRFGVPPQDFGYCPGDTVDLAVTLEKNEYRGSASVSVLVRDIRPADFDAGPFWEQKCACERFARKESVEPGRLAQMIPSREELGAVYRLLRGEGRDVWPLEVLLFRLSSWSIGYDKLYVCLRMLAELDLAHVRMDGTAVRVQLRQTSQKVSLDRSKVLQQIKSLAEEGA